MERRYILFIVLVILILGTHFGLRIWLAPPPKEEVVQKDGDKDQPKDKDKGKKKSEAADKDKSGKDKTGEDRAADDAKGEKQAAEKAEPKPPAEPPKTGAKAARRRITIGSLDPASGNRMLITIDSRGAAVERVELAGDGQRRFFDTDDKTGYLGHLALSESDGGCLVNVVGAGTPAALAKEASGRTGGGLMVRDVITALNDEPVADPTALEKLLAKLHPEDQAELTVERRVNDQKTTLRFTTTLTRHPLDLIGPEVHLGERDPLSFLVTLYQIGGRSLKLGDAEFAGLNLYTDNWELTKATGEMAEFTYRVDAAALERLGQKGPLRIVKRYTLNRHVPGNAGMDHPNSLKLAVEIHNESGEELHLAYRLSGPNGLPLEGWWYLSKLHPKMFYTAGARDVVYKSTDPAGQKLLGCREIYDGALEAKENKETYERTLLASNKAEAMQYLGVDTQFFAAVILPQKVGQQPIKFRKAFAEPVHDVSKLKKDLARTANVSLVLVNEPAKVAAGGILAHEYEVFLGPKDPDLLAQYGLANVIEKGWPIFEYPTNFLSWVLHFIHRFTRNYGIAIVLLTMIVRACMLPLSIKQAKNAAKMQELAPEIKKIKEKFAGDTEKMMKAQQELYKKHNFNMFGGCLPVFIQLPIFIGLYRCLSVDVALRDAPLIPGLEWASNLAGPDQLLYWKDWMWGALSNETGWLGPYFNILPVITCVLFILQQKLFMPPATDETTEFQQKMMMYMTVFMGVMFFKVPAGLCIYFIVSTSWSIIERTFLPKYKPGQPGTATGAKTVDTPSGGNGAPRRSSSREKEKKKR